MAEKRMFTQKIIDSDAFLDMPLSAQALYFHLNMRADDDGFVNNPRKITRYVNASDDDLKLLLAKRFIIGFDSGVIVIKHWRMHNTLKSDRYKPTDYQEEFAALEIKKNKSYTERSLPSHDPLPLMEPNWNQTDSKAEPQNRIDKNKNSKEEIIKRESKKREKTDAAKPQFTPPTLEEVKAYCEERNSSVDPVQFWTYFNEGGWKDAKGQQVQRWKQKLLTWEKFENTQTRRGGIHKASCDASENAAADLKKLTALMEGGGL